MIHLLEIEISKVVHQVIQLAFDSGGNWSPDFATQEKVAQFGSESVVQITAESVAGWLRNPQVKAVRDSFIAIRILVSEYIGVQATHSDL